MLLVHLHLLRREVDSSSGGYVHVDRIDTRQFQWVDIINNTHRVCSLIQDKNGRSQSKYQIAIQFGSLEITKPNSNFPDTQIALPPALARHHRSRCHVTGLTSICSPATSQRNPWQMVWRREKCDSSTPTRAACATSCASCPNSESTSAPLSNLESAQVQWN